MILSDDGLKSYNVRCCCTPSKILGTIRLPCGLPADWEVIVGKTGSSCKLRTRRYREFQTYSPEAETFFAPRLLRPEVDEIAVSSEHRPIEFWRTVWGFKELVPVGGIEPPASRV